MDKNQEEAELENALEENKKKTERAEEALKKAMEALARAEGKEPKEVEVNSENISASPSTLTSKPAEEKPDMAAFPRTEEERQKKEAILELPEVKSDIEFYTEKLGSEIDWEREQAKEILEQINNSPFKYYQERLDFYKNKPEDHYRNYEADYQNVVNKINAINEGRAMSKPEAASEIKSSKEEPEKITTERKVAHFDSASLDEARQKYAEEYKKFMNGAGRFTKAKRAIFGVGKIKDVKVPEELKNLEKEYDAALVNLGNEMNAKGIDRGEIFKKIIVEEQEKLTALKSENLPDKEKGVFKKGWDWYSSKKWYTKMAISLPLSVGAGVGLTFVAMPGMAAAAGGMGAYAGIRAARSIGGALLGKGASEGLSRIWKDKSGKTREDAEKELAKNFNIDQFFEEQLKYKNILEKENKSKRRRGLAIAGAGILAGGAANIGIGYGAGQALSSLNKASSIDLSKGNISQIKTGADQGLNRPGATLDNNAVVHKGQGIENALKEQMLTDKKLAQDLGFKGDINDAKALRTFAEHEAHKIALEHNQANLGISEANKATYKITGVDEKGKAIIQEGVDNKKYEYARTVRTVDHKAPVEHRGSPTHALEHQEKIKIVREQILEKYNDHPKLNTFDHPASSHPDHVSTSHVTEIKPGTVTLGTRSIEVGSAVEVGTQVKTGINPYDNAPATPKPAPAPSTTPDSAPTPKATPSAVEINPELKGTIFEKENFGLSKEELLKANKFNQELYSGKNAARWIEVKNNDAKDLIGVEMDATDQSYDASYGETLSYYNKAYNLVLKNDPFFKPYEGGLKPETVEHFMARVFAKLAQEGRLDQLK